MKYLICFYWIVQNSVTISFKVSAKSCMWHMDEILFDIEYHFD